LLLQGEAVEPEVSLTLQLEVEEDLVEFLWVLLLLSAIIHTVSALEEEEPQVQDRQVITLMVVIQFFITSFPLVEVEEGLGTLLGSLLEEHPLGGLEAVSPILQAQLLAVLGQIPKDSLEAMALAMLEA
jgi:hypothetical protein